MNEHRVDWKKWNRQVRIERMKRLWCLIGKHDFERWYGEVSSFGVYVFVCKREGCEHQVWRALR